jgi:hypothetical protein
MTALLDKLEAELGWLPVDGTAAYTQDSAVLKEQVRMLGLTLPVSHPPCSNSIRCHAWSH